MAIYDAIVIGSGFGGTLAAWELVRAGLRVLMLERGGWVRRGPEADGEAIGRLSPHYSHETPYHVFNGDTLQVLGGLHCVGGPSVYYGGAALRFRSEDFEPDPEIVGDSGAAWPFQYAEIEPYYCRAERIIGVAGEREGDPTEPFHSAPYPHPPGSLSPTSRRIAQAARRLGLHPFRLPLALNHGREEGRAPCVACGACDGFACQFGAKNDLATAVLPDLLRRGMELQANMAVVRLLTRGDQVEAVECVERPTGHRRIFEGRRFILAAGALASPHLVLASGLERLSPARDAIGRYLTRHFHAVVLGFFPSDPNPERQFHKQIAIHDFYFGHPSVARPRGKLGAIQQIAAPPPALVRAYLPAPLGWLADATLPRATGLTIYAEDQPRAENRVELDPQRCDGLGLPGLRVQHRHTRRDLAAGQVLVDKARQILHAAGAWLTCVRRVETSSHAAGTLRMGDDPVTAPLDRNGRFRGIENLYVTDASTFPTSAGVNPSLTIAANALRIGEHVARLVAGGREALRSSLSEAQPFAVSPS